MRSTAPPGTRSTASSLRPRSSATCRGADVDAERGRIERSHRILVRVPAPVAGAMDPQGVEAALRNVDLEPRTAIPGLPARSIDPDDAVAPGRMVALRRAETREVRLGRRLHAPRIAPGVDERPQRGGPLLVRHGLTAREIALRPARVGAPEPAGDQREREPSDQTRRIRLGAVRLRAIHVHGSRSLRGFPGGRLHESADVPPP